MANERQGATVAARVAWAGRLAAPVAAVGVYLALGGADSLSDAGRATAAIGVLMAILWMTEAMPLPATSLLPAALFPLAGVAEIRDAAAPYAHELIFLFGGGFMLALAMERWGLHKRVALLTVLAVGTRPVRLIGGFMLAAALLSMWISNTATTVMMLPIAVSVIGLLESRLEGSEDAAHAPRYAVCLLLGMAYAASIGGVATIIGTPPNVILVGYMRDSLGVEISFARWMAIGAPFSAVFLILTWLLLTRVLHPVRLRQLPGGRDLIRNELHKLGPMSRGEWTVFIVFLLTATLWIVRQPLTDWPWLVQRFPQIQGLHDGGVAIIAAVLLFALPVHPKRQEFAMDWETARRLPWGVLLLFGGGLSLARAVSTSGLDAWIGSQVSGLGAWPTLALVYAVVMMVIFLTELTSNTATATTFLPILGGVAIGLEMDARVLVIPAAIAASCAFMMPVATPPNAIVFGSGRVRIADMVQAGVVLNLVGGVLITALAYTVILWALGGGT